MTQAPPPPPDPTAGPSALVTRAELRRLVALRRVAPWGATAPRAEDDGDVTFLLDLVDRLLARATLPDEDVYRPGEVGDRWTVTSGPSVFMCGHGDWHVHEAGRPGIVAGFTGGVLDATRLRDALNGRDPRGHAPPSPSHVLVRVERQKRRAAGPVRYRYRCACDDRGDWTSTAPEAAAAHRAHAADAAPGTGGLDR